MEFEAWLSAKGFDASALSATQRISLESMWRKESAPLAVPASTNATAPASQTSAGYEEIVAKTKAENDRRASITTLVAKYLEEAPEQIAAIEPVGRLAIEGNWSKEQTELHLLRMSRPAGPSFFSPSQPKADADVVEAAMARAAGLSRETIEKSYGDRVLSAADRQFKSGVGIQRLLILAAQANGYRAAGSDDWGRTLKAAFHDSFGANGNYNMQAAGPSTFNVSTILSNVANKFSWDAFNAVESVWRKITAVRPVNDFKEHTGVALTGDMTYQEVGYGAELKHAKLGEETYGNQAKLFGILLGIDYKQLRNDDLGEFAKSTRKLGRGGALTINREFWKTWNDNAAFFSVANGNYRANTDVAMTLAGLAKAHSLWAKRTDPDNNPMGDLAKYLLVPTAYDIPASEAMTSVRISNDGGEGERNVLAGKWEVLSSTYLDNVNVQPGATPELRATAATAAALSYYLLCDPNDTPVIETVFLDGREVPVVEEAEMDKSRLGIVLRATHAFGCRKQEKRGGYKFKTTA